MQFWAKTHTCKATWTKFIHKKCKAMRHKLTNLYTLRYTHIFTHARGRHMARTTQEGAASLKIMKIPLQLGLCTAGRGSAASALESVWRLASHLAAVVAEHKLKAIMINMYHFSTCNKLCGTSVSVCCQREETENE